MCTRVWDHPLMLGQPTKGCIPREIWPSLLHQTSTVKSSARVGPVVLSSLRAEMLTGLVLCTQLQLLWVHGCKALPSLEDVTLPCSSLTSGFYDCLPPLRMVPEPCGEGCCIDAPLDLSSPPSLILCVLTSCESLLLHRLTLMSLPSLPPSCSPSRGS